MKNLIAILLIFSISAHVMAGDPKKKLPENNQKVLDYVEKKIGKKVGRGWCRDLVNTALRNAGCTWSKGGLITHTDYENNKRYSTTKYGKLVKVNDVLPGDIIIYNPRTIGDDIDDVPLHVAIIYEVIKQRHYVIASQNNATSNSKFKKRFLVKGSKTELIEEDFTNGTESGYVIFFRPMK